MVDRYDQWIDHVFNHRVEDPAWYFNVDEPLFEVSDRELVALFTRTMLKCGVDLLPFDNAQIDLGLNYIFDNSCSNYSFQLRDSNLPIRDKARAIVAIKHLYSDCFEKRCAPVLSHLDEPGGTSLNYICYMLWDVTPLSYWGGCPNKEFFYQQVLDVLEFALKSSNIACVESALHGLGHIHCDVPKLVEQIVDRFLYENKQAPQKLLSYARDSKNGLII